MERKHSFPPVIDARTRVLILGSLPGERSLAEREYYAHPQNRFWDLVGAVVAQDLRALAYQARLAVLRAAGIGLWDVIAHAGRTGSLDSAIRDPVDNDLVALADSLPQLRAIAFNGRRSAVTGQMRLGTTASSFALIDLPSSSPAYAAMPPDEKQRRWLTLRNWLGGSPLAEND